MVRTMIGALLNRAATTPVPFASRSQSYALGFGGRRDATAQLEAMGSVGTLFAIVDRCANATAQVNWRLYRKSASGKDGDRVEVTSHAALDLWRKPNKYYTQQEFIESFQQHHELTGEAWWVIGRDTRSSIPLELWPVRPDRMAPVPDPETFLAGYVYTGPGGERVPLGLDDVVQLRRPNPVDPYRGMGPVQSVLADLDASRYSAEWNRNFFINSATPGGIVEVDRVLGDTEFNQLRERWAEQHKGVANAHRVAILEAGMKWSERSFSQRDMQFVELRAVSREVIREAYAFPKPMLGTVDDANRANMEAAEVMFARWVLVPRLERIKQALNNDLLPLYGGTTRGFEFDYDNPVPEDRQLASQELTAKAAAAQALVSAGFYAPEVREALDLPEMSFGQPGADQDRELLIDLVKAAPAALAKTILPLLGFDLPPEPEPAAAPVEPAVPAEPESSLPLGPEFAAMLAVPDVQAAQRWEAVSEDDDNTCEPCRDNNGQLYRNRAAAYRDYPGGSGYIHCEGAKFGNDCRCKVVKRGKADKGDE